MLLRNWALQNLSTSVTCQVKDFEPNQGKLGDFVALN